MTEIERLAKLAKDYLSFYAGSPKEETLFNQLITSLFLRHHLMGPCAKPIRPVLPTVPARNMSYHSSEKDLWSTYVYLCHDNLKTAPLHLKNEPCVVLEAVKKNGLSLCYASYELRNDFHIALIAVKNNGMALEFCSDSLKANKEIVLAALEENPKAFKFVDFKLKSDPDIQAYIVRLE